MRIIGIFMVFILTSCPIKASIKLSSTSQPSSGLTIKHSKLITPLEAPCVLEIKENLVKVGHSDIDFSPSVLLLAFFFVLFLGVPQKSSRVYPPRAYYYGSNNLFLFIKRFNL
ncbi:hypothetical protein [Sphingobacterium paucimobilis]|uniref:Lipoprotein n=1 Tax=Sphingobacterium paucimobilis HER1398 TaxID=1346330 RepID=U2HPX5_9SPHI|nr:hypothetical protein [Sphingobacterium paucimobilis]ERJ57512.1 hypothetical protein M472_01905 [Sphingobacterium paucimobilis HER1398]